MVADDKDAGAKILGICTLQKKVIKYVMGWEIGRVCMYSFGINMNICEKLLCATS